jgi:Fur family iron response transcriptional regulator
MSEVVNGDMAQAPGLTVGVKQLLASLDINITSQRLQIASVLLSAPMHLSADQLLERLRHDSEPVSKATVYNTLKLFVERGLIRQINLDPERTVYDSTRTAHHHFHDVETGTLWDIDPKDVEFSRLPQLPEGMEIAGVEVIIRVARKPTESAVS